jgi:hypothetical protein
LAVRQRDRDCPGEQEEKKWGRLQPANARLWALLWIALLHSSPDNDYKQCSESYYRLKPAWPETGIAFGYNGASQTRR